jgi:small subunit ribosomal protein S21
MHARHSHLKPAAGQAIIPQDRGFGVTVRLEVPLQVLVRDNNVEQAIRVLKKKMQREGLFREMKQRKAYEKPSQRKTREKAEAVRRARKVARKKAQREGLLPAPKRREPARPGFGRPRA